MSSRILITLLEYTGFRVLLNEYSGFRILLDTLIFTVTDGFLTDENGEFVRDELNEVIPVL